MNIDISHQEIALLNGLLSTRLKEVNSSWENCGAIKDKNERKSAEASVKIEMKQLEGLLEKVNYVELAIPNKHWGSERNEVN